MANLLSSSIIIANREIPQKYVVPPKDKAGHACKIVIPIIDLHDEKNSIQHIMKASQDLGLFQVINHGISRELMNDAMKVFKEVFELPPQERSKINMKEDLINIYRIYSNSYNYDTEEFHFWRDVLRHNCNPLEESIRFRPQNLESCREIVKAYVFALKCLGRKILEQISKGLGLEKSYFANEITKDNILTINHYPKCPDPSLIIGLPKRKDPTLINIVQAPANVPGHQLLKDEQWFDFETAPNAFLVFVGKQFEVISNGKMKGVVHRIVTNSNYARTTAVFFVSPLYKAFRNKEHFDFHNGHNDEDIDVIFKT
ncbi:hyoscyamine 6-dioxygenase-like [Chenopodium quinoa]|uniref:hyoscyamine 6-dioxygenase-like n=1 Tax=Chenopodium quinoa TaxID=63459 RepID=UPI000B796378|nr:hyoscyamine 6-dioxygenase-like [Chenopodium quinoa]